MKKVVAVLLISTFIFSYSVMAYENQPLKKLGTGLNNIVYGNVEIPKNINETNSKGTPAFDKCTAKTNDDFGRGIARTVGGIFQVLTFWYPEDEKPAKTEVKK